MGDADDAMGYEPLESLTWREQDILHLLAERRTNREIAQSLGLELTTVKWYNRQIYSKLGVSSRTQAVAKAKDYGMLDQLQAAPVAEAIPFASNLPAQLTSFVGRESEVAEVRQLLEKVRLLTLTGPGGTGKTRLALQAASELADTDEFQDGIYFVALAPLSQPELVADTIAEALGVALVAGQPSTERLSNYLRTKKSLLLLDNFEHVIGAATLVVDLLAATPDLKILVTSREGLQVYGEQEYSVPPLTLPELSNSESLSTLTDYEAVVLFIQRARAINPEFNLTDKNGRAVAEICVRLDGLPLAIELAAARIKLFSSQALLGQLESRFTTLRGTSRGLPARQQTLRSTIDWSYDLLDEEEQRLFSWLSVFQGGSTIEAAQTVCGSVLRVDILDGLESLLNKSLLWLEEGSEGEPRFGMLETIHEYARQQLDKLALTEELRRRHAEYFTAFAERTRTDTRGGPNQLRRLHQLESEHDNLRAALDWSLGGADSMLGMRLTGTLGHFWWRQGHYAEGQRWTTLALNTEGSLDAPAPVRAALLDAAGLAAHFSHERERGKRLHREALVLYQHLDDKREMGWVLVYLAAQSFGRPDEYREAIAHVEESLSLLRSVEDRAGVAQALHVLGELARLHGDYGRATNVFEEGLSLARELGDVLRQAFILDSLGYLALYDDDPETAATLAHESLNLALEVGYKPHIPACLAGLAAVYVAGGMPQHAARLLGAADALFDARGFSPRPSDTPDVERTRATVREMLGTVPFDTAWAEGRAMRLEEAIAYALDESRSRQ